MLRDMNVSAGGRRDSTSPYVGVLASAIPTGSALPSFLINDIDSSFPNRLYSVEILTLPNAGTLYLDKTGSGTFTGAPSGTYTGTQRIEKFDEGVGRVSSANTTYTLTISASAPPADTAKPVMNSPLSYGNLAFNSFILSVPAATDDVGVVSYAFSTDNGVSFTNTGLTRTFTASGKTPSTLYHCQAVALDAAGNVSDPLLLDVTTGAYVSAAGGANSSRRGSGGGRHRFST